jgi:MOSC domain-containing protein YiiM
MTYEDQIQHGCVVHVGLKTSAVEGSIRKTSPAGHVHVRPGGVVGDYHYCYEVDHNDPRVLASMKYQELMELVRKQGGVVIQTHQVCLFEKEVINEINDHRISINLQPGDLGENITTQGIRLNEIRLHSIIKIGNIQLKVQARRSICAQFFSHCDPKPYTFIKNKVNELGEMRVGILCQVLDEGTISVGDNIVVLPNKELQSQPWQNLPISGERKIKDHMLEYISCKVS